MRIAIVNDQEIAVHAIKIALQNVPSCEIVWVAVNGIEAIEKCHRNLPDLILMNLIMPVLNGVEATCRIMQENPCAILLVSSSPESHQDLIFEAMGCGALDIVTTPHIGIDNQGNNKEEFLKKISTIAKLIGNDFEKANSTSKIDGNDKMFPLIAIGSSTGGPKALLSILKQMPATIGASIVIVQHVDSRFAGGLAEWLGSQTSIKVTIAIDEEKPEIDAVHVAASNDHLIIDKNGRFKYVNEPANYHYRPSVNEFFFSLARGNNYYGTAVILTGMGNDGATGMLELKKKGWHTIAQDASSSIVYGMPKAAAAIGAADEVLPLSEIANSILTSIGKRKQYV